VVVGGLVVAGADAVGKTFLAGVELGGGSKGGLSITYFVFGGHYLGFARNF